MCVVGCITELRRTRSEKNAQYAPLYFEKNKFPFHQNEKLHTAPFLNALLI